MTAATVQPLWALKHFRIRITGIKRAMQKSGSTGQAVLQFEHPSLLAWRVG
jgi:hypothetical protein